MVQQLMFFGLSPLTRWVSRGVNLDSMIIEGVARDLLSESFVGGKNGGSVKTLCFSHNEKSPSLVMFRSYNRFKCYGCGLTGGPLELIFLLSHNPRAYLEHYFGVNPHSEKDKNELMDRLEYGY